jgi:methylmalonyl-CoA mutase
VQNFDVFKIDNSEVRRKQIERINKVKATRDSAACQKALEALTSAAISGQGNLMELSVKAAELRATVGEISMALEKVYGRHVAKDSIVRGAYAKESMEKSGDTGKIEYEVALQRVKDFSKQEGRNPRILVAKMGQDGHDRGAKVIASGFADLGFDVDVGGLFQTPEEVARQAIDNDVHVVGASSLAAGHNTLIPALKKALAD